MSTNYTHFFLYNALSYHTAEQLEDVIQNYDWLLEEYLATEAFNSHEELLVFISSKLASKDEFNAIADFLLSRDVEELLQVTRSMGVYSAFIQQEFEDIDDEEELNPALFLTPDTVLRFVAPIVMKRAIESCSPADVFSLLNSIIPATPQSAVSVSVEVVEEPAVVEPAPTPQAAPVVTEPATHPTTFTRCTDENIYILTVDRSVESATTRYLDTHKCDFSRLFSSNGYTRYTIFTAPASVIASIAKKYNPELIPAAAPVVMEPAVTQPPASSPAFVRVGTGFHLTVAEDKHDNAREYLTSNGCRFSCIDIGSTHYTFFVAYAPAPVITALTRKFGLVEVTAPAPAPVVEEPTVIEVVVPIVEEVVEELAPVVEVVVDEVVPHAEPVVVESNLLEHVIGFFDNNAATPADIALTIAYLQTFLPAEVAGEEPVVQEVHEFIPASYPEYDYTEVDSEVEEPVGDGPCMPEVSVGYWSVFEQFNNILSTGEVKDLEEVARNLSWIQEEVDRLPADEQDMTYEQYLEFMVSRICERAYCYDNPQELVGFVHAIIRRRNGEDVAREIIQFYFGYNTEFAMCESREEIKSLYRELAKNTHPDKGGCPVEFAQLNKDYKAVLAVLESKEPALV